MNLATLSKIQLAQFNKLEASFQQAVLPASLETKDVTKKETWMTDVEFLIEDSQYETPEGEYISMDNLEWHYEDVAYEMWSRCEGFEGHDEYDVSDLLDYEIPNVEIEWKDIVDKSTAKAISRVLSLVIYATVKGSYKDPDGKLHNIDVSCKLPEAVAAFTPTGEPRAFTGISHSRLLEFFE